MHPLPVRLLSPERISPIQITLPSSFQGLPLGVDAKRSVFFGATIKNGNGSFRITKSLRSANGLQITARTAAAKNIEVEVDKPLGLTLGQKQGGGVIITRSCGGCEKGTEASNSPCLWQKIIRCSEGSCNSHMPRLWIHLHTVEIFP